MTAAGARALRAQALVSLAQLVAGLTGLVVSLRRRYVYDTPALRGSPQHLVRDALVFGTSARAGTAGSAP